MEVICVRVASNDVKQCGELRDLLISYSTSADNNNHNHIHNQCHSVSIKAAGKAF